MERLIGDTVEMSEWTDFRYYELCKYWDKHIFTEDPKIGIWLGVSHRVSNALC